MDVNAILIYLLSGLSVILGISLVYVLVKEPKEILFGILRGLKDTGRFETNMLFSPIWIPAFFLDKYFKLGIYNSNETLLNSEDKVYNSVSKLEVQFSQYQKYIIVESTDLSKLKKAIDECNETTPEEDFKGILYYHTDKRFVLKVRDYCIFYNYHYLIQWLDNELNSRKNMDIYGLALNQSDSMNSYYVVSDRTGEFINCLTGKTFLGDKFSINLYNDYGEKQWLDINNNIKIDKEIEFGLINTDFSGFEFVEM